MFIGAGFGYYPFYPYRFYDPFYPAYFPAYGPTIVQQETVVQETPVVVESYPGGTVAGQPVAGVGPVESLTPSGQPPASATVQEQPEGQPPAPEPGSMEDLLMRGDYAFSQGQYAEARALYMQATVADAQSPHPKFAYALAGFALGDYKVAAASLRRGMQLFPDLARSEADLRGAYRIPGDYQRHLNALVEYTNANPNDADAWLVLGYMQYFTGARAAGLITLGKALDLNPADEVIRAFFAAARENPTPQAPAVPTTQPASSDAQGRATESDPVAEPQATAPAPATATPAAETPRTVDAPEQPVIGSEPGVQVEFGPPGEG